MECLFKCVVKNLFNPCDGKIDASSRWVHNRKPDRPSSRKRDGKLGLQKLPREGRSSRPAKSACYDPEGAASPWGTPRRQSRPGKRLRTALAVRRTGRDKRKDRVGSKRPSERPCARTAPAGLGGAPGFPVKRCRETGRGQRLLCPSDLAARFPPRPLPGTRTRTLPQGLGPRTLRDAREPQGTARTPDGCSQADHGWRAAAFVLYDAHSLGSSPVFARASPKRPSFA